METQQQYTASDIESCELRQNSISRWLSVEFTDGTKDLVHASSIEQELNWPAGQTDWSDPDVRLEAYLEYINHD